MFVIFATKPLNDGTSGFRFNFLGQKGLLRKRSIKSRGFSLFNRDACMTAHHIGKFSLYVEHNRNKVTERKFWHFAGQMRILLWKRKYVVYDDDGKVVIMCHNKRICRDYAKKMKTEKDNES